jgi:Holliday junction resolvasome RuvABC endonuclease subunit
MAGDPFKIKKNKVPIKKIDTERVLALDAATGTTGYSIYDNRELVSYGTYTVDSTLSAEERINKVKQWLAAALKEWEPDFVGLENIQLQKFGPNAS